MNKLEKRQFIRESSVKFLAAIISNKTLIQEFFEGEEMTDTVMEAIAYSESLIYCLEYCEKTKPKDRI